MPRSFGRERTPWHLPHPSPVVPTTPPVRTSGPDSTGHGWRPAQDGVGAGGAVDVQDIKPVAGGQADVGLGVAGPPGQDPGPIGGGVLDAVGAGCPGVLGSLATEPDPDTSGPDVGGWLPPTGWRPCWWGEDAYARGAST